MEDELASRVEWFNAYVARCEAGQAAGPAAGVRHPCPCCGYPMLSERGGYGICRLCSWEDDGQDDPHADEVWGGPNGSYSLSAARLNFRRHLSMYDPGKDTRIGGADGPLEIQAKKSMVAAFNAMPSSDGNRTQALWEDIFKAESTLLAELRRKISEYEEEHRSV